MQEEVRMKKGLVGENRMMSFGGKKGRRYDGEESIYFSEIDNPVTNVGLSTIDPSLVIDDGRKLPIIQDILVAPSKGGEVLDAKAAYRLKPKFNQIEANASIDNSWVDNILNAPLDTTKVFPITNNTYTPPTSIDVIEEPVKEKRIPKESNFDWNSLGQALPIISNAAKSIYNAAKPIDYSNVVAEQSFRDTPTMDLPRIGGKQVYRGIDRNRFVNPIINQGRATARDIQNTALTAGQALANLANANYNTQRAIGEAYANADQQDLANRLQVAQFNLGIDQANANLSQAEQAYNMQRANRIAQGRIQDAAMREQLQQMKGQAIDKTSTAAVQGVADLTRQNIEWNWIKDNPAYAEAVATMYGKKANGGMLTKRKRRR